MQCNLIWRFGIIVDHQFIVGRGKQNKGNCETKHEEKCKSGRACKMLIKLTKSTNLQKTNNENKD